MTGVLRACAVGVLAIAGAVPTRSEEVVIAAGPAVVADAQAAIDRLSASGGGTVRLPPGRHLLAAPLRLASDVVVAGVPGETVLVIGPGLEQPLAADAAQGADTIELVAAGGFAVGDGVAVEDAAARGFHVSTGTLAEQLGPVTFRLSAPLVHDYRIERRARVVRAYPGIGGWNIHDAAVEDVAVEGTHGQPESVFLDGCRGGGFYLFRCDRVALRRCVARRVHGDGISFQRCREILVEDCVAERNANAGLHPGAFSKSCTIRATVARDNGSYGLFVCVGVQHGTFAGNRLTGNGGCGISIGCLDTDNLFRDNLVADNAEAAVIFRRDSADPFENAHRNVFEHNEFVANVGPRPARSNSRPDSEGRACVVIEGPHWGLVWRSNLFSGPPQTRRAGMLVDAAAAGLTVTDNRLVNVAPLIVIRPDAPPLPLAPAGRP